MATSLALSALCGALLGFPLLQWALRFDASARSRFEQRGGVLFLPLLAGTLWLLFRLYRPGYAWGLGGIALVCLWGAGNLGRRKEFRHAAAALLIGGIFATEGVLAAAARQKPLLPPGLCVAIAGGRGVPPFVTALTTHYPITQGDVWLAAATWHEGDRRVLPVLLAAVRDPDPAVGADAASALAGIGSPAMPALIDLLLTSETIAPANARIVETLQRIGDPKAVAALMDRLRESRRQKPEPSPEARPPQGPSRRTVDPTHLRVRVVGALGRIGDGRARPLLEAVLLDPREDDEVRATAAWAVGDLAGEEAVPVLIAALQSGGDHVRNAAAERLAVLGGTALPALRDLLRISLARSAPNLGEGDWAAWALGKRRDRGSIALLQAADRRSHYRNSVCVFCEARRRCGP
jgi:hypothetical protein